MINKPKICTLSFLLIILNLSFIELFSQNICIESFLNRDYYRGIDNPLTVHISNLNCDSILLVTNNGRIRRLEDCRHLYLPTSPGVSTLTIYNISYKDTIEIGKKEYKIKELPKPTARVGDLTESEISKNVLKAQLGISLTLENFDLDLFITVERYKIIILRGDRAIFIRSDTGNRFSEEVKTGLSLIEAGDTVYFVGIIGKYPSGAETLTNAIEFLVK